MSLNILNKRFLSLLCYIGVDIDAFPDKTFDGLFERRQNELNYFLEWFVDNITSENTLSEAEVDIYQYLQACNLCLTDEELHFALLKWTPTYEDLELLDENYIDTLAGELEAISVECDQLMRINFDLEIKYEELKKKPNQLKEECNRTRKKLEQSKDKLQVLNSTFTAINEDMNDFKLNSNSEILELIKFKSCAEEEEMLTERFGSKNFQNDQMIQILNMKSNEISKLKMNLSTSKYCTLVSKSLIEEVKHKTLRAEEFLNKLKDESDSHFTFEEVLSIWFDLNELNAYDKLSEESDDLQMKDLMENLDEECELIWHNFLSCFYHLILCDNNSKISKYSEFLRHIKLDVVNNLLLQQIMNISKVKEKELADSINGFYIFLNKTQNSMRNVIENIKCKNKKTPDYFRNINEKHALLLSCKRYPESLPENVNCDNHCDAVELLFDSRRFYPEDFINELENAIASSISNVLPGPTHEIKMAPIDVEWEFSKCDRLLAANSHSIQRLLTEYVNTKESISSSNRRLLLLWIDFLINPDVLFAGLERLQAKSIKCSSELSDM